MYLLMVIGLVVGATGKLRLTPTITLVGMRARWYGMALFVTAIPFYWILKQLSLMLPSQILQSQLCISCVSIAAVICYVTLLALPRSLGMTWAKAGDSARQIFVAQKLQSLIGTMMQTVGEMPIDKLTIIDRELATNGSNFAVKAAVTAEQLKQMMGIDLAGIAQRALPSVSIPPASARTRPPTQPGTGTKPPGA